ncbi:hypothetical protein [Cupriavidus sp. 8B]
MTAQVLASAALVALAALPPISVTTVVPVIASVAIAVVPSAISAVVRATAPIVVPIGGNNAAAQQCNGSCKQYKNGLHSSLQLDLRLHPGYALSCMSDVGSGRAYNKDCSYNEARA